MVPYSSIQLVHLYPNLPLEKKRNQKLILDLHLMSCRFRYGEWEEEEVSKEQTRKYN